MDIIFSLVLLTLPGAVGEDLMTKSISVAEQPEVELVANALPARLSDLEVQQRIEALPPAWTTDGTTLFFERTFGDFVEAIAFVNQLVEPAEVLGHHPDIIVNYNRVSLSLTTHDAGGLTELDFQLAEQISAL